MRWSLSGFEPTSVELHQTETLYRLRYSAAALIQHLEKDLRVLTSSRNPRFQQKGLFFQILLSPHGHYFVMFADGAKNHIDSGFKIDYQAEIGKTIARLYYLILLK